jgi:hypothetical protein
MKHMLENSQSSGLTETEIAFLGGSFLGAGSISVRCSVASEDMQLKSEAEDISIDIHDLHGSCMFSRGTS